MNEGQLPEPQPKTDGPKVGFSPEELAAAKRAAEPSYIEQMLEGKEQWPLIEIEGWKPFRIRPLSNERETMLHAVARHWVKDFLKLDPRMHEDLANNRGTMLILYEALVTADSSPDDPENARHLTRNLEEWCSSPALSDIVLADLYQEYMGVKLSLAGDFDFLPESVRDDILVKLKKKQAKILLERWPRSRLMALIDFLANRDESSTGSSSTTGPSSEG